MNSLPKTVTLQCCDCDLNPGPAAPESSTLTTRLPSRPFYMLVRHIDADIRGVNTYVCNLQLS